MFYIESITYLTHAENLSFNFALRSYITYSIKYVTNQKSAAHKILGKAVSISILNLKIFASSKCHYFLKLFIQIGSKRLT